MFYKFIRIFFAGIFCLFFFCILSVKNIIYASGSHPPVIVLPPPPPVIACPNNYVGVIQKIDPDNVIRCYGAKNGMGFETNGLQQICGPVLCPMELPHDNLSRGQSCIRQDNAGICHPGTGASGFFDNLSDPAACTAINSVKVSCPPSLPLYIKAVDEAGKSIRYGTLKLVYNDAPPKNNKGKLVIVFMQNADSNGLLRVNGLYAGDHFTITPLDSSGKDDVIHSIGNKYKFFQEELDTPFSCGVTRANPCVVTVVYKPVPAGPLPWFSLFIIVIIIAFFIKYVLRII